MRDIRDLPRGGWSASRVDRRFETDEDEYLDRDDVSLSTRTAVLRGLDRLHRLTLTYRWLARLVLAQAAGVDMPRVLELGAGHGELSRRIVRSTPSVHVTVSDVDTDFVAALRASDLGRHPQTEVRQVDATAIDAADLSWDVAVFALSLHHLPPEKVAAALRETTRVARTALFVDAWRNPLLLAVTPLFMVLGGWPMLHDGIISIRRMYARQALHDLAASPTVDIELRTRFVFPGYLVTTAKRSTTTR